MTETPRSNNDVVVLERKHFQALFDALLDMGFEFVAVTCSLR